MRSIAFATILYFLKLQGLEGFQSTQAAPVATTGQIPARFVNFLNSLAQAKRTEGFQTAPGSTGGTGAASGTTTIPTNQGPFKFQYPTCASDTDCTYYIDTAFSNPPKPDKGCTPLNTSTTLPNRSVGSASLSFGIFLYSSSQTLEMFDASGNSISFTSMSIKDTFTKIGLSKTDIDAMNIPSKYDRIAIALGITLMPMLRWQANSQLQPLPAGISRDSVLSVINNSAAIIPSTIKLTPASFFTTPVMIGIGVGVVALVGGGVLLMSRGRDSVPATP